MDKDEALDLALEELENCADLLKMFDAPIDSCVGATMLRAEKAITAIQQARSAPVVQEPVGWMYPDDYERMLTNETFCTVYSVEVGSATRGESTVPLYTSPPAQRPVAEPHKWVHATEWRGLTDEEIEQGCKESWVTEQAWQSAVWWAEAKLRSKNT